MRFVRVREDRHRRPLAVRDPPFGATKRRLTALQSWTQIWAIVRREVARRE
jgi:hypothetical protein